MLLFYCFTFRARSHQHYAELWLDFLSFARLLMTFEMTSWLAGVVLRLWTRQDRHFFLLCICIQFTISGMYCCCHVLGTLYFCTLILILYCTLMMDCYLLGT